MATTPDIGPTRARRSSFPFAQVGAILAAGVLLLSSAGVLPARADEEDPIRRMDVTAAADADGGAMHVTADFEMEFRGGGDHGPYVTLPTRQAVQDNPDVWRVLDVSDVTATSPSGAPAQVEVEREDGAVAIRVGDEGRTVEGVQHYIVSYTLGGVVNPRATGGTGDEIYWNAIGTGWEVPMEDVSVTVEGPVPVTGTRCYAGSAASDDACTGATTDGTRAVFTQDSLAAGQGLTVVAQWPAGTFTGAEPVYAKRLRPANTFALTPATGLSSLGVVAVGAALVFWLFRRFGRDVAYQGLTPGLTPAAGAEGEVGRRRRTPVAVRFTPPEDATASEIGTLVDGTANSRDVVAGIVDLATRGYLRVEEVASEASDDPGWKRALSGTSKFTDWRLHRLDADRSRLPAPLARLDEKLFAEESDPLLRKDLGDRIAQVVQATQSALYREMVERGWYRRRPDVDKALWILGGLAVMIIGAGLAVLLAWWAAWGLVGLGVVLVGLALGVAGIFVSTRTPQGSAVLAQAEGFKEYLMTAEADQIRVEEDHDIFSRYLPWAMVFGVESRWVGLFREMVAAGRPVAEPSWYASAAGMSVFSGDNAFFGGDTSFVDASSSAGVWSASAGAGGMSGMSGGSVGGGVGGGGGGSW